MSRLAKSSAARLRSWSFGAACAALGSGFLLVAAPGSARAQLFDQTPWGISRGELRDIVASQGFRLIARPYRNGSVFVADVVDGRGFQRRLIIDAYRGSILQNYSVAGPRSRDAAPGAPPWPDSQDGWSMSPPRAQYGDYDYDTAPPRPVAPIRQQPSEGFDAPAFPGTDDTPQRTARDPADDGRDPPVIPGMGPSMRTEPSAPVVRRQVKPRTPKAIVRSTPLAPPASAGNSSADLGPSPLSSPSVGHTPGPAHTSLPPRSPGSGSETTGPGPSVGPATPGPATTEAKPTETAVVAPPKTSQSEKKAVVPDKKKQAPLNDVPPAPLD